MKTHRMRPARRLGSLAAAALALQIFVQQAPCPDPVPPGASQARTPAGRFLYQVARPVFDPGRRSSLYISGYAGRRPAPRGGAFMPLGHKVPRHTSVPPAFP